MRENRLSGKKRQKSGIKIAATWVGVAYLILLHAVTLLYFLPSVTIHKDYINQQQGMLIARGEAIERCIVSSKVAVERCADLRLSSTQEYEVGVNSTGINGWSFTYKLGRGEISAYRDVVAVSITGRIADITEFSKPH